mgnify:CR=1 FL=1
MNDTAIPPEIAAWFAGRGWRVRRHQAEMLAASDTGRHALLVADTGAGKTVARIGHQRRVEGPFLAGIETREILGFREPVQVGTRELRKTLTGLVEAFRVGNAPPPLPHRPSHCP